VIQPRGEELGVYRAAYEEILSQVRRSVSEVDPGELGRVIDLLIMTKAKDRKVVVTGAGRSGLVARAFAMRLMHLGFNVYVFGETIVPAVQRGDLMVAISGSGATKLVVTAAQIAKEQGAKVLAVTSRTDSPLAKAADQVVAVRGRTREAQEKDYFSRQIIGEHESLAPLGTVFETSCSVFLDSAIAVLMSLLEETETDIRNRHSTIE